MFMENFVGKRLDGRYEIQEIIGVGGMAVVYKAYDNIDDRTVAVKVLKEEFLANEEFRRRFKNESKTIAMLSHPNIVKVYDVSFGEKLQYIVMEYIEGITLKEYIEQQKVLNWKEAVHFTTQILRALQHAHDKGIVHRDVKPQNIMLLQNGNIKVTDFGIARFNHGETRTMTESAIGSVHYISPEQARGETTNDKADIYSVGVVMYEMLTGQLPFQSENAVSVAVMQLQSDAKRPREINSSIPVGLEQITVRAMQKNPAERYQSAGKMLLDLEEFKRNPNIEFDYTYFVDKEPTKFVSGNTGKLNTAEQKINNAQNTAPKKNEKLVPALIGIGVGLVAVIGIIIAIVFSLTGSERVVVPDFQGKYYDTEIKDNPEYTNNFKLADPEYQVSDQFKPGQVVAQNPAKGKKVRKGTTIKLTIARSGSEKIKVPDVIGLDFEAAKQKLADANLECSSPLMTYDPSQPVGKVIATSPEIGESVNYGDTITVYVNSEDNPNMVTVPKLVDLNSEITLDIAKQMLESADLVLDTSKTQKEDSDHKEGCVIRQSIEAGSKVEKGTKIWVTISTGKKMVDVSFKLPNTGTEGVLSAYLNSDSVKSGTVLLNGSTYKLPQLTGSGTSNTLIVNIDGKQIFQCNIDFTTGTVSHEQYFDYSVNVPDVTEVPTSNENRLPIFR